MGKQMGVHACVLLRSGLIAAWLATDCGVVKQRSLRHPPVLAVRQRLLRRTPRRAAALTVSSWRPFMRFVPSHALARVGTVWQLEEERPGVPARQR